MTPKGVHSWFHHVTEFLSRCWPPKPLQNWPTISFRKMLLTHYLFHFFEPGQSVSAFVKRFLDMGNFQVILFVVPAHLWQSCQQVSHALQKVKWAAHVSGLWSVTTLVLVPYSHKSKRPSAHIIVKASRSTADHFSCWAERILLRKAIGFWVPSTSF